LPVKYRSKDALVGDIDREYAALLRLLRTIPVEDYLQPGVWGDDWNIRDLLAHLFEWHRLLLGWYDAGTHGLDPEMPAPGYRWNETPRLNRAIWSQHQTSDPVVTLHCFQTSHSEVAELARSLSEAELLQPGFVAWTRRNPLATYVAANSASHYRFASRALKRWLRGK